MTLKEALELIQELDYVPGVSMAVPDFNYVVGKRRNFDPVKDDGPFPYDSMAGAGIANSVGEPGDSAPDDKRGRGRPDHSGGPRAPSAAYTSTWQQDEGADWDELQRHGGDERNIWRDTPDGKSLKKDIEDNEKQLPESMGSPMQIGPVAPMDGPQHNVLNFSGSVDDMLPKDDMRGPGNMWGGPGMIPGGTGGWATDPNAADHDPKWKVPEGNDMKLREFFDPAPIEAEALENPDQDGLHDQTDDELEDTADRIWGSHRDDEEEHEEGHEGSVEEPDGDEDSQSFVGRYGGETIMMSPNPGHGLDFVMSPDKHGAARGTYGMHMDGKDKAAGDLLDKRSAWDVLQHVINAMARSGQAPSEKPENEENTDFPG